MHGYDVSVQNQAGSVAAMGVASDGRLEGAHLAQSGRHDALHERPGDGLPHTGGELEQVRSPDGDHGPPPWR